MGYLDIITEKSLVKAININNYLCEKQHYQFLYICFTKLKLFQHLIDIQVLQLYIYIKCFYLIFGAFHKRPRLLNIHVCVVKIVLLLWNYIVSLEILYCMRKLLESDQYLFSMCNNLIKIIFILTSRINIFRSIHFILRCIILEQNFKFGFCLVFPFSLLIS